MGLPGDGVTLEPGALVCSLGTCGWGEEQGGHPTRGVSRNTGVQGGWKAVGLDSREVPERGDAADMRASSPG